MWREIGLPSLVPRQQAQADEDEGGNSKRDEDRRKWLGGRESLPQFSETPTKTSVFSTTCMTSVNWRFQMLSSAGVCLLLFSDFASAMTLEMTLAPNVSRASLVDL
jgi:hypothetical protein